MSKRIVFAAAASLSASLIAASPAAAESQEILQRAPVGMQQVDKRAIEVNQPELRLSRIESKLAKLEAENAALKSRISELEERSERFIRMPEGCRAGFANGLTVGVRDAFGSNLFPYLTCRAQ